MIYIYIHIHIRTHTKYFFNTSDNYMYEKIFIYLYYKKNREIHLLLRNILVRTNFSFFESATQKVNNLFYTILIT